MSRLRNALELLDTVELSEAEQEIITATDLWSIAYLFGDDGLTPEDVHCILLEIMEDD